MKKCPSCNSTKYTEELVDHKIIRHCKRCGYVNKADDKMENNHSET